jgi:hypothetical protein
MPLPTNPVLSSMDSFRLQPLSFMRPADAEPTSTTPLNVPEFSPPTESVVANSETSTVSSLTTSTCNHLPRHSWAHVHHYDNHTTPSSYNSSSTQNSFRIRSIQEANKELIGKCIAIFTTANLDDFIPEPSYHLDPISPPSSDRPFMANDLINNDHPVISASPLT